MHLDILLQQVLNGLVLGSVYALVALGYTMVYGILQLINFAHGDVLMIGAMVGVTVVGLLAGSGLPGPVILLIALAAAIPACVVLSLAIERIAYRPLRHAPRLAPLITAIGVSIVIQTLAMIVWKPNPIVFPDLLPTEPIHIGGALLAPTISAMWSSALRRAPAPSITMRPTRSAPRGTPSHTSHAASVANRLPSMSRASPSGSPTASSGGRTPVTCRTL